MHDDQVAHDCESQSEAANRAVQRLPLLRKHIEHARQHVRFNADAFTGGRDLRSTTNVLTAPANAVAPQGTGGRVGVQLKF